MVIFKRILKTFGLAVLAGMSIGFGAFGFLAIKTSFDGVVAHIFASFVFTIGLFTIVCLGFNLFTGKIAFILDKKEKMWLDLIFMYIGNFVGAIIMGYLMFYFYRDNEAAKTVIENLALSKSGNGTISLVFLDYFLKSLLCGMLVFLAVFIFGNAKSTLFRYLGVVLPIMLFVLCGFEHCIANMAYFAAANMWDGAAILNIVIVSVGNSLGAIGLYGLFKLLKVEVKI